jgi:hypothetical protein
VPIVQPCVGLGATHEELGLLLGKPTERSAPYCPESQPMIWRYGEIEYHLGDDGRMYLHPGSRGQSTGFRPTVPGPRKLRVTRAAIGPPATAFSSKETSHVSNQLQRTRAHHRRRSGRDDRALDPLERGGTLPLGRHQRRSFLMWAQFETVGRRDQSSEWYSRARARSVGCVIV